MSESDDSGNVKGKEIEEVIKWLDQINIKRPKKRIHRDFSDGKLLAEIIKEFYPKLVNLHNYSARFSVATKKENWQFLNKHVLKKLHLSLDEKKILNICNCTPGVVEELLFNVMERIRKDEEKKKRDAEGDKESSDGSWYDVGAIDEDTDIMVIPVRRRCGGDNIEIFKKKVISYDCYETVKNDLSEKNEAIEILKQKVCHLENMLKTKDIHLDELHKSMSRKSLRSKKNEISLMDSKPEILSTILALDDLSGLEDDIVKESNVKQMNNISETSETLNDLINFTD